MKKSTLIIPVFPTCALPLTYLAHLAKVPKATLRNWKRRGLIKTYRERGQGDMVSLAEMSRLEDAGLLKIL